MLNKKYCYFCNQIVNVKNMIFVFYYVKNFYVLGRFL